MLLHNKNTFFLAKVTAFSKIENPYNCINMHANFNRDSIKMQNLDNEITLFPHFLSKRFVNC